MTTIKVRSKGVITLPVKFRRKYGWQAGKTLTVLDLGKGTILLKSGPSQVTEAANQVAAKLREANISLDDMLETLDKERKQYFQERYGNLNG